MGQWDRNDSELHLSMAPISPYGPRPGDRLDRPLGWIILTIVLAGLIIMPIVGLIVYALMSTALENWSVPAVEE